MKKTFTTLAAFCLGLLVSASIVACADDLNNEDQTMKDEIRSLRESVALLSERVSVLEQGNNAIVNSYCMGENTLNFEYLQNGAISKCHIRLVDSELNEVYDRIYNIEYTDTGCAIKGDEEIITIKSNSLNEINRVIISNMSCIVRQW